jgi:hypothetical protein
LCIQYVRHALNRLWRQTKDSQEGTPHPVAIFKSISASIKRRAGRSGVLLLGAGNCICREMKGAW